MLRQAVLLIKCSLIFPCRINLCTAQGPLERVPDCHKIVMKRNIPEEERGVANMKMDNEEPMGEGVASIEISIHVCGKQINLKCMCV